MGAQLIAETDRSMLCPGVLVDGKEVAVKVQYPGVADSISSDLNNLGGLLKMLGILPKGMYLVRPKDPGVGRVSLGGVKVSSRHRRRIRSALPRTSFCGKRITIGRLKPRRYTLFLFI
jgi:hypothetical protein